MNKGSPLTKEKPALAVVLSAVVVAAFLQNNGHEPGRGKVLAPSAYS